jgi:hypothetical protein
VLIDWFTVGAAGDPNFLAIWCGVDAALSLQAILAAIDAGERR